MGKSFNTIINEIDQHISLSGKRYYSDFYVGITKDVQQRLFGDHNVSKENSWWIYRTAETSEIARNVEKHYLNLGMRGGPGGGDNDSCIVYCYVVAPTTIE